MSWYKTSQTGISLWLDDNRDPSDPKIQELFGALGNEVWVKTVDEAINYINQGNVDFISFDHDLDNNGELLEKTGYELAKFIEEGAFDGSISKIGWNVHSRNPIGAQKIVDAMTNADRFWGTDNISSLD